VMNITDVGHLTSDADEGEDKMEKGARRTGRSAWEIAELYTEAFRADLKALNIEAPCVWCRATDHIAEQIAFISDLEQKGYTYLTSDGVYFDTSRQPQYGYLSRLDKAGLEAGHRIELGAKRNATDFALWKSSAADEKRQMEWESPWGKGFPGWHIECSAMAQKYLGDYFDIHCGGEDHIPVHHTNEIAQTEARVGTRLANFWMHGYFLVLSDAKMAKAGGDALRLQTLLDHAYDPLAYRYLCLTAHYRSQLKFTWEALDAAQTALNRLRTQVRAMELAGEPDTGYLERIGDEINNDLNFPRALALVWEVLKSDLAAPVKKATLLAFDRVLGLDLGSPAMEPEAIPEAIAALASARWDAKRARRWAEADRLRDEVNAAGYEIEDQVDGYRITRRS
jgi:cysteinyl-tRNA synthetase